MTEQSSRGDERSTRELVNVVLTSNDEDDADSAYWEAMSVLRRRGTVEVFDTAKALCLSLCPYEQRVGCEILAQLGGPEQPFASASFPLVASVIQRTDNLDTLGCALCALGWLGDLRGVDIVLPFVEHPHAWIRYWVTQTLVALDDDPRCITGLIRLTTDASAVVRDWATFGLGSQIDVDTPEIRAALFARVADEDEITRGEALVGLARRKDARVLEPLIRELEHYPDAEYCHSVEAAETLADARLLPVLKRLQESSNDRTIFDKAIRQCSQGGIVATELQ
jgi:HEAT repeat protein